GIRDYKVTGVQTCALPISFVFTPVDVKAMVPAVQKINAAGIPLVNVADKLTGGDSISFIGTDDYAIALDTARFLLKAMGSKGNQIGRASCRERVWSAAVTV